MSQKLYDTANQLERELRQSEPFLALKKALEAIDSNKEAKEQFESFKQLTQKFQELQETGTKPTEKDLKEAEEISKKAQENELILALVQAEQAMSVLMNDLNTIITKPLSDIYGM